MCGKRVSMPTNERASISIRGESEMCGQCIAYVKESVCRVCIHMYLHVKVKGIFFKERG